MFHITSSLFGGLAAIAAWAIVSPSFDPASLAQNPERVDRAVKSDRLASAHPSGAEARTVSAVEVIGVHDAAIVYRDRDGRLLFQTDPVNNVTVVSKGLVLPQITVRETTRSASTPMTPQREPSAPQATPAIPIGCEPLASPIAEPRLAHLAGRCLS